MEGIFNETKNLTLEQGRNLLKDTSLSQISDLELQQVLEDIKLFCEINYEIYLDNICKIKMMQFDDDFKETKIIPLVNNEEENSSKAA